MLRYVFPSLHAYVRARTHASGDPRKQTATYRTYRGASESLGECLRYVVTRRQATSRNIPQAAGPEVDSTGSSRCAICQPGEPASPAVRRAHLFLAQVAATLTEKNRRYGDSAASPLRVFSHAETDEQLRVRIDDKLSRIARGTGVDDEDTLLDLCGYLALLAAVGEDGLTAHMELPYHHW